MEEDSESRHCKEDKYACQKKESSAKENNDREETHKNVLTERLFWF